MTIPVGYSEASFVFTGPALPRGAVCTLGFDNSAAPQNPTGMALILGTHFGTEIMPELVSDVTLDRVEVKFGPDEDGPAGSVTNPVSGLKGADSVTPNTSILVQKATALGGRKNRGRMFVPGLPENEVGGQGLIVAGVQPDLQLAFDNFLAKVTTDNFIPVVLHGGPETPTPLTNFSVQGTVATQRRRLRK